MYWKVLPVSQRILAVLLLLFISNIISGGWLNNILALSPALVVQHYEIWRLFTYPFVVTGFWSMALVLFVAYVIMPELEAIISPGRLYRNSLIFLGLHGILYTLALYTTSSAFSGPVALALALIAVFVYMYPAWEYSLFGLISLPMWMIAALIGAFAIVLPCLRGLQSPALLVHTLGNEVFGAVSGLAFAQLHFRKYTFSTLFRKKAAIPEQRVYTPSSTYAQSSAVQKPVRERYRPQRTEQILSEQDTLDENRLNDILDKMNEHGHTSLSAEEQQFLKEYARRL